MAEPKVAVLVKSVESLLAEKRGVAEKEKQLVETLNRALGPMGYRVVPAGTGGGLRGRRRRRRRRKAGRPGARIRRRVVRAGARRVRKSQGE